MRNLRLRLVAPALFLVVADTAAAQTFVDFCPSGNEEIEAAVVGFVTEAETVVPGVTVAASWVRDNARQRVEAPTNMEGLFVLCGLPKDMEVSLRALLGDRRGEAVSYTTAVSLAQQDLLISLTAEPDSRAEVGSLADVGGGRGRAYSSEVIRAEDLLHLPEMSVYELLRQHQLLSFSRRSTVGEVILLNSVSSSLRSGRFQSMEVRINERREADGVSAIRDLSIDEISRIEILSRTEASARYGGDGFIGAIIITMRNR
ncbi:TonB-dependent receptor [Candidatus Palauibacter sp.]|uniref:TonB-dependent receptor n=1 Tax=Candidatus Palauibacter sp. TaxID=3101350 RepID=UPI003AF27B4D